MIRSFADARTERLWRTGRSRRIPPQLHERVRRKLVLIDSAIRLNDLASQPGNRLELLKGDREGQHSIRINDQFRVCFRWMAGDVYDVQVTDYH